MTNVSSTKQSAPMISIYDGRSCFARGRAGLRPSMLPSIRGGVREQNRAINKIPLRANEKAFDQRRN